MIVEQGSRRGLLLPQVATEHGWDRETFLEHTCVKAGLPADAWRRGARIRRFQAEVFGESIAGRVSHAVRPRTARTSAPHLTHPLLHPDQLDLEHQRRVWRDGAVPGGAVRQ